MSLCPCTPSALLSTGTISIVTFGANVVDVVLHPGSAASTVTVYDNASAGSGTILAFLQGVANGASIVLPFDKTPVRANKGITCVVAGTAAQAQIFYLPEY